jgi:methylthioribulose-1-phosphate dehydratase
MSEAKTMSFAQAAEGVVEVARFAGARGWVPATSGNFSVRMNDKEAALTATGVHKAHMTLADVIEVEISGPKHPRSSAEGPLHLRRYERDARIGAIAHIHSMDSTLLSRRHVEKGYIRLEGWELLKVFTGITTHDTYMDIPVVPNDQDTDCLADLVEQRLAAQTPTFGYLIAGHGLYVWGASVKDVLRHMEAFDFLFTAQLQEENAR